MTPSQLKELRDINIALARRSPWHLGRLLHPDFFTDEKWYLKEVLDCLVNEPGHLFISLPPRHGKSLTLKIYEGWRLGTDPTWRIIKGSYNDDSALSMSKATRDMIEQIKHDEHDIVYSDVFPERKIRKGDSGAGLWSVEGGFANYVATGRRGTVTGKGAKDVIIDDPIKDASEAFNANCLNEAWSWISNTIFSRLESGARIIINMTRWSDLDPIGRFKRIPGFQAKVIEFEAYDKTTGKMLAPSVLSFDEYLERRKVLSEEIFWANYHNILVRLKGALYPEFKTYSIMPDGAEETIMYIDYANTGSDFLTCIIGKVFGRYCYVEEVVYTDQGIAISEPLVVESAERARPIRAKIESQAGGEEFAIGLTKKLPGVWIESFHQSGNKIARIHASAKEVSERILMPEGWQDRWPEFYLALMTYIRIGKNEHDDAPDGLTGLFEMLEEGVVFG